MIRDNEKSQFVPIYQKLVEQYKNTILTQKIPPGTRIDSINEIQSKHKVSRETAKTVLKILSDEGFIVQKPGMGSFIADLGPCKKIWGVIVPFFSSQTEQLIHYLRQKADSLGRQVEIFIDYNNYEEEIRLVGTLINSRYEAVIMVPTFDESKTALFYKRLQTGKTLVTLLNHTMVGSYFPYVIQSYDLGVRRAVQYLLEGTNKALAYIKNNIWLGRNMIQEVMQETFKNFIQRDGNNRECHFIKDISLVTKEFIQEKQISGIFCCDDIDAVRLVGRLGEWGFKMQDQISLVSYGNTDVARFFTPAITSIDPHYSEMAALSSEIIHRHLKGDDITLNQHVLQPELVIRNT